MPRLPSPPDLASLQLLLREVFTDPRGARAAAAARPESLACVVDAPPVDAATRLSVYGDAYFLRLLEALTADFMAVRRAVGEADFRALVAHYLSAHPSTSPSLADAGEAFPDFVAGHELGRARPYLAELARLERCVVTRLLTDRLPALEPAALAAVPAEAWERATLVFDPTVELLSTAWPVERLWLRREEPEAAGGRTLRARGARGLVVHRDEVWVRVRAAEAAEFDTLRRLRAGERLGPALAAAAESGLAAPAAVQGWFGAWLSGGLIKGVAH